MHQNKASGYEFPPFEELPAVCGQPQGSLWGFFDKGAEKDELGTLNLLSPSVVLNASKEIKYGEHVQLDWSMDNLDCPSMGRIALEHRIKDMTEEGFIGLDDEIRINTQTSSQWDSLKHWSIQKQGLFYNGLSIGGALATHRNGIHSKSLDPHFRLKEIVSHCEWISDICRRGGIVGRGVLVDWLRWWQTINPERPVPSAITEYAVSLSDIENVLKWQGTECKQGDIFILRTGFLSWYNQADATERTQGIRGTQWIGMESTMESVRWLYNNHFSAVASDTMSFEVWPPKDCCLHEWLLCQWGTPIGELWDLEELSATCAARHKWSFFFTSAPLNIKGGVGSPPNAIAIL